MADEWKYVGSVRELGLLFTIRDKAVLVSTMRRDAYLIGFDWEGVPIIQLAGVNMEPFPSDPKSPEASAWLDRATRNAQL